MGHGQKSQFLSSDPIEVPLSQYNYSKPVFFVFFFGFLLRIPTNTFVIFVLKKETNITLQVLQE